jgi:hypothetical protein
MATATDLNACIDRALALQLPKQRLLAAELTCETEFLATPGNTQAAGPNGGKVFRDPTGAEVDVDRNGGKVFHPAWGTAWHASRHAAALPSPACAAEPMQNVFTKPVALPSGTA